MYALPSDRLPPGGLWRPGVPGGVPARSTVYATVTPAWAASLGLTAFGLDGSGDATAAISYALSHCPSGQVVQLPAGDFYTTGIYFTSSGVTLRGAGPGLTRILHHGVNIYVSAFYMWRGPASDYGGWGAAVNVTSALPKGATTLTVGSSSDAARFPVGTLMCVDQLDDTSYLYEGMDGTSPATNPQHYFKRSAGAGGIPGSAADYGPVTTAPRSQGQWVEVTAVSGTQITFDPPLHVAFNSALTPQIFRHPSTHLRDSGIEDLYITGGGSHVVMQDAGRCWVRHVESDGSTVNGGLGMRGAHVLLQRCFRCEVRDSYLHDATQVVQGGGAYGISLSNYSSDNLVENNIVFNMNKPFTLRASGGGNVVAYNYMDDAWTGADPGLMETTIDLGHASFPHMELAEGNYTGSIATENVWGNSGWCTVFRNCATGKQARTDAFETYQVAAISMEIKARYMSILGNVLGYAGVLGADNDTQQYEVIANPPGQGKAAVYRLGHGVNAGNGYDDIANYEIPASAGSTISQLLRDANWDAVTGQVHWHGVGGYGAANGLTPPSDQVLPDSMYLTAKPAFFGATAWPPVNPYGATSAARASGLPAKLRYDAGTPNTLGGSPAELTLGTPSRSGRGIPRFSLSGNTVVLDIRTPGARVYWSTSGPPRRSASNRYTGPITVAAGTTVYVRAWRGGRRFPVSSIVVT